MASVSVDSAPVPRNRQPRPSLDIDVSCQILAPIEGQPPDDYAGDLASRLIVRAHPEMVRAASVRGRRLEGPASR